MNKQFSGAEIIEVAVEIEKNGRDFYNSTAARLKDEKAKELFKFMAEEESQHIIDFKGILSTVMKQDPCESYPQEYFSYLNAIAGQYVFTGKQEMKDRTKNIETDKDALDFSLGMEKDSILFYEEIKRMLSDKDKQLIEQIIEQEKNHVKKLWGLRARL
jgi:rubrerythrin